MKQCTCTSLGNVYIIKHSHPQLPVSTSPSAHSHLNIGSIRSSSCRALIHHTESRQQPGGRPAKSLLWHRSRGLYESELFAVTGAFLICSLCRSSQSSITRCLHRSITHVFIIAITLIASVVESPIRCLIIEYNLRFTHTQNNIRTKIVP